MLLYLSVLVRGFYVVSNLKLASHWQQVASVGGVESVRADGRLARCQKVFDAKLFFLQLNGQCTKTQITQKIFDQIRHTGHDGKHELFGKQCLNRIQTEYKHY